MSEFAFIANVPEGIREFIETEVQAWVDRGDFPVLGLRLPNGVEVDFCRRPWPPRLDIPTTVGCERDSDEDECASFLANKR
jgi:hypothetical protein